MFRPRHLRERSEAHVGQFPCVLLQGARQAGKSTFLRHALTGWQELDLESPAQAAIVSAAPDLFLRDNPDRVWFDEAQQVPGLFAALRHAVDLDRRPGGYVRPARPARCGSATWRRAWRDASAPCPWAP
ncbi:MAG: AAA family ATPase [Candidatus Latescibacterota bacterium]